MFHALHLPRNLDGPSVDSFWYVNLLRWETQKLTPYSRCGLTSVTEVKDNFPETAGYILADTTQEVAGLWSYFIGLFI